MSTQDLTNHEIDEIIQFEFPYVIATNYKLLLTTEDVQLRDDLIFATFNFSIRALSIMLVVRYLRGNNPAINNQQYNATIRDLLPKPQPQGWIDLLAGALEVYRHHRDSLFMPELYDLYWETDAHGETHKRNTPWENLQTLATLENDYRGKREKPELELPNLLGKLRQMMRDFSFFRDYEMWLVDLNDHQREIIRIHVYRGSHIRQISLPYRQLINPEEIENHHYYLTKLETGNTPKKVLKLDPLVVDSKFNALMHESHAIGLYDSYYDDSDDQYPGRLEYLVLAASARGTNDYKLSQTPRDALVAKFLRLYNGHLVQKEKAFQIGEPFNWENLRTVLHKHSLTDMENSRSKYDAEVYVEREKLLTVSREFLAARQLAMVITGKAGAGKSNFLVNTYDRLHEMEDRIPLWLDGAKLDSQKTIPQILMEELIGSRLILNDDASFSSNERLWRLLKHSVFSAKSSKRQLVIFIDAINENKNPIEILETLNNFINEFAHQDPITLKVIISSRPQVWRYARAKTLYGFTPAHFFKDTRGDSTSSLRFEDDSFVLSNYTRDEQIEVFNKLANKFQLTNANLASLSRSMRETLREPLILFLTCQTYRNSSIPEQQQTSDLIDNLIDSLIDDDTSKSLEVADITFLEKYLVPLFLPAGEAPRNTLTRNILANVELDGRTLDDLVSNNTPYSDGTAVNAQFQRLMNTGWLTKGGTSLNYQVRFRYEYFYDHFTGKLIFQNMLAATEPDKAFFDVAFEIDKSPFLWGPLCTSLFSFVTEKKDWHILDRIVERLETTYTPTESNRTRDLLRNMLVIVIADLHYENANEVHALLERLLPDKQLKKPSLSAIIALEVAYEVVDEQILFRGLLANNADVESTTVQLIYRLWVQSINLDSEATSLLDISANEEDLSQLRQIQSNELKSEADLIAERVIKILDSLLEQLSLWKPVDLVRLSKIALILSFTLGFYEYSQRSLYGRLSDILGAWSDIIGKFRFLFGKSGSKLSLSRRLMMYPASFIYVNAARLAETEKYLVFSVSDLVVFFPPDEDKQQVYWELTEKIKVQALTPEQMNAIYKNAHKVLSSYDDLLTAYMAWGALIAMQIGNTMDSAKYVMQLFEESKALKDTDKGYAPVLTALLTMIWQNTPFFAETLSDEDRLELLKAFEETVREYELHFRGKSKGRHRIYYSTELAEYLCMYYLLTGETIAPLGVEIYDTIFNDRNDKDRLEALHFIIQRFGYVARTSTWELPNVALDNLREIIARLEADEYADLRKRLEPVLVEIVASIKAVAYDQVDDFLVIMETQELNPHLRDRIRQSLPSIKIDYVLSDGVIMFLKAMIADEDPTVLDAFKDFLWAANDSNNVYDWVSYQLFGIGKHIRNSTLVD